jgi:hypothetical protein
VSDHISGPRALAEPAADITDLYAFTSPERPGHLTLVLNTRPFAETSDGLWEALVYRFRIRPLALANDGNVPFVVSEEEFVFDCTFSAPTMRGSEIEQQGECRTPSGKTVPIQVGEISERGGVRIFAGARWDPFIMDARAALRTIETGQLAFQDTSSIYLDGKNVLSIVLEVDCAEVLGDPGLVAVVGETLAKGVVEFRFERTGRPEVKNMLLAPKQFDQVNRDLEIRDLYNSEDAFRLAETYGGAFRARLNANLAFWDSLDGKVDWPSDAHGDHPLTDLILADFLAVDPSRPYAEQGSFLEIEMASRAGRSHVTCGGRSINDDVMDTLFTLWVNGGNGPPVRDGIDRATRPAVTEFPYLASPNPSPPRAPHQH